MQAPDRDALERLDRPAPISLVPARQAGLAVLAQRVAEPRGEPPAPPAPALAWEACQQAAG